MVLFRSTAERARDVFQRARLTLERRRAEREGGSPPARALSVLRDFARDASFRSLTTGVCTPSVVSMLRVHGEAGLADGVLHSLISGVLDDPSGTTLSTRDAALTIRALLEGGTHLPRARLALSALTARLDEHVARPEGGGIQPDAVFVLTTLMSARQIDVETSRLLVESKLSDAASQTRDWASSPAGLSLLDVRALIELELHGFARNAVELLKARARDLAALAHLAVCAYRLGHAIEGDSALERVDRAARKKWSLMTPSVAALYLEANRLRVAEYFDRIADELPNCVDAADGRAAIILQHVNANDRVLEVGCGKARFLDVVQRSREGVRCTGVDLSFTLVREAAEGLQRLVGTLENIPCRSNTFDVVCSVEAVEHSANWPAAIHEAIRVARPGGTVVIIDKPMTAWGRMACPTWERWPGAEELLSLMRDGCDAVEMVPVSYDSNPADGLIVAWRGRKRIVLAAGNSVESGALFSSAGNRSSP